MPLFVAVDDFIPIHKEAPKYVSMIKGKTVWPYLLEKAWCKQIGGYEKAKGLSP